MATAAALEFCAFVVAEYGKSKLSAALATGWISLAPTVLLPSMSVAATALLPTVLRAAPTQPLGEAVGSPSNETTVRVSVDWVAVGCALTLNTRPVNVLTSDQAPSIEPSAASTIASWYCCTV